METPLTYERPSIQFLNLGGNFLKYLFGYNLHQANKDKRKEIRDNENDLGRKVLELSLNYSWEFLRQAVRYLPLAVEGMLLYGGMTEKFSPSEALKGWFLFSAPFRIPLDGLLSLRDESVAWRRMEKQGVQSDKILKDLENAIKANGEVGIPLR